MALPGGLAHGTGSHRFCGGLLITDDHLHGARKALDCDDLILTLLLLLFTFVIVLMGAVSTMGLE